MLAEILERLDFDIIEALEELPGIQRGASRKAIKKSLDLEYSASCTKSKRFLKYLKKNKLTFISDSKPIALLMTMDPRNSN